MALSRNRIRCKKCGDIIESKYTHDFQQCKCGACFVDGGLEYQRIGGYPDEIENLCEYSKNIVAVVDKGIRLQEVKNLELETFYDIICCDYIIMVSVEIGNIIYECWIDEDVTYKPARITMKLPNGLKIANTVVITRQDKHSLNEEDIERLRRYVCA